MEITEDIPERSCNKTAAHLFSENQTIWKGDGKRGNTIWKLHLLHFFAAVRSNARAPSVSLLDCARFFLLSTDKTDCYTFFINLSTIAFQIGEYIPQQHFLLYE